MFRHLSEDEQEFIEDAYDQGLCYEIDLIADNIFLIKQLYTIYSIVVYILIENGIAEAENCIIDYSPINYSLIDKSSFYKTIGYQIPEQLNYGPRLNLKLYCKQNICQNIHKVRKYMKLTQYGFGILTFDQEPSIQVQIDKYGTCVYMPLVDKEHMYTTNKRLKELDECKSV